MKCWIGLTRPLSLPNIVKIAKHWEGMCKSKRPQNKSYKNLTKHYLDKLFTWRLQFFKDIASQFRGFLELMQTDEPMVPFLEEALSDIVLMLMKMIVKRGILMEANTSFKLMKIYPALAIFSHVSLSSFQQQLKLWWKQKCQTKRNTFFLKDCQAIIVAILQKVQERCPLKYGIVCYADSLFPLQIVACREKCNNYFCKLVDKLYGDTGSHLKLVI